MKSLLLVILVIFVSSVGVSAQSMFDKVNDFDGDGRADYAVTRDESGLKVWYLWRSTGGFAAVQWGLASDTVSAADYDGDSLTDIAVTRLANAPGNMWVATTYYMASATGSVGIVQVEMINIVGSLAISNEDYDGDRKADAGIFQWHAVGGFVYRKSSTGTMGSVSMEWFLVRQGDLTGDGAAEVVSHNPGTGETVVNNVAQGGQYTVQFGTHGHRWVGADFDGDNKGDISIFRPSTGDWWSIRSSDNVINVVHWGLNGDTPVPADYDNDGKTDQAVYRPGSPNGIFWVNGSTGVVRAFAWGVPGDAAVQY